MSNQQQHHLMKLATTIRHTSKNHWGFWAEVKTSTGYNYGTIKRAFEKTNAALKSHRDIIAAANSILNARIKSMNEDITRTHNGHLG